MYRTHNLGELRINNAGEKVVLSGWVSRVRDLSNFLFVILRESNPQKNPIFMKNGKIIEKYSTHLVLKRVKKPFLD